LLKNIIQQIPVMVYEEPTFFIKGGDVGFADRQKRIFNILTVEEKNRNERQDESDHHSQDNNALSVTSTVPSRRRSRSAMKQYRGKESIFKKPDAPAPRFKNKGVPDHHRNPHKWIKYSLGDVSQEDMSDRSNTAAALSFLKEMQERKRLEQMEVDDSGPGHITFKQPVNKSRVLSQQGTSQCNFSGMKGGENATEEDAKQCFRSSKLIMPEYIIGITKKKDKKKHEKLDHFPPNENVTSEIKLQHLTEEDDGE
jgi:hypothetical protein